MFTKKRKLSILATVVVGLLTIAACTSTSSNKALKADQQISGNVLTTYERTQPAPQRPWSQLRQNLIELETAQSDTTQTTTFFFNLGVQAPIQECPSIGFPIASTSQITNPSQVVSQHGTNSYNEVVPQIDPNGIYAGDSTGTYVMCVDAQGRAYADYWEGSVQTVTGPAKWDSASNSIQLVGAPSFKFSSSKRGTKP